MMIIYDFEQRSDEWYEVRLGKITGTDVAKLVPSGVKKLAMRKTSEILTGQGEPVTNSPATDHGTESEPLILERIDKDFERPGFVELDQFVGCSPDGLGDEFVVEIKCPYKAVNFINLVLDVPIEYRRQIQFNLWVCQREYCVFAFYNANFTPDLIVREIKRDETMISQIAELVDKTKGLIREYLDVWSRYENLA